MKIDCNCLTCSVYKRGFKHGSESSTAAVADMRRILYKIKFAIEQTIPEFPPDPSMDTQELLAEIIAALDKSRHIT